MKAYSGTAEKKETARYQPVAWPAVWEGGAGVSDERPEALLKSALEKIIYFEARSEALHNDLATARDEASRLKAELAQASQRELELRRQLAQTEVQLTRSHREREELGRMNDALRGERSALIEKFIEANRIHQSDLDVQDGGFDLASFIALLRSEAMGQPTREARPAEAYAFRQEVPASKPEPAAPAAPTSAAVGHAERLRAEGRLGVDDAQLQALSAHRPSMPGRTEETLFGFSLRELSAPDPAGRTRAAERLKALGQSAAAPALATALHRETESGVLVALLATFAELAGKEGVAVVAPHLTSSDPDVRIGALKALLALDVTQSAPHLSAAMKDPDSAVRRRATLLALGLPPEAALRLGREAIEDGDPEVRAVGALALGAAGGESARGPLLRALDDSEEKVRAAAAKSVSRVLGEDVSAVVKLEESQRRREIRRLAALPARPMVATARPSLKEKLATRTAQTPGLPGRMEQTAPAQRAVQTAPAVVAPQQAPALVMVGARAQPSASASSSAAISPGDAISARFSAPAPAARSPVAAAPIISAPRAQGSETRATGHFVGARAAQAPVTRPALPAAPILSAPRAQASARQLTARPPSPAPRAPDAPTPAETKLRSAVLTELRRSIRGKTLPDLSAQVGKPAPEVELACAALTVRGDVVRRGIKYFVA